MEKNLFEYVIRLADNALIMGHRLSEWTSKAPILEQDIALTNIALDYIGQARMLYQYAAELKGDGCTEDDLAYLRDAHEFKNCLLVEMPNGDFAQSIIKLLTFSAAQFAFYQALTTSADEVLRGIAEKSQKEIAYHLRWSSEWTIRLGDGTPESNMRMKNAIQKIWAYIGELWTADEIDIWAQQKGIGIDLELVRNYFFHTLKNIFAEANLMMPENSFFHQGGKRGQHTEYLGYILAEMQFLQRAYPNSVW